MALGFGVNAVYTRSLGGATGLTSKTPFETGQDGAAPVRTRVSRIDGRRLRSERTRQLIIEAYLALLWRNQRMPTAAQIAAEAGYSTRSIFERFVDLNALTLATADYAIAQAQAEAVPQDVDADRASRIRAMSPPVPRPASAGCRCGAS